MFEKMKDLFAEFANVDRNNVVPDAKLKDDLGIDSLYAVELTLELETIFDIQIEWEEIKSLVTVGDLVSLVERKTKK